LGGTVTFKAVAVDPATRTLDARVEVDNAAGKLRPGMYAMAKLRIPIKPALPVVATSAPAINPAEAAAAIAAAVEPYRKASDALAADTTDDVADLVRQTVAAVRPLGVTPELAAQVDRMAAASVKPDAPIREVRSGFRELSAGLIEIARSVGLPEAVAPVQVVRCAMSKGSWIEPRTGAPAANPYMGRKMLKCGDLEPPLPAFDAAIFTAAPAPKSDAPAGLVLAVPTSAVIDTGPDKIVYVESAPGVFDMRAVTVGPEAAGQYPVLAGLEEGERVVTVGTFLVDAENRLNPQAAKKAGGLQETEDSSQKGHAHVH
ncbi:MAG TPA: efflux RND transporter periplasmic adaptor subunit, partial [Tepidisphaeraceae bacterium]|nr:efflux RND transporter periplasmic adaptor subunit [Tepidisphaeraceae bacterium]